MDEKSHLMLSLANTLSHQASVQWCCLLHCWQTFVLLLSSQAYEYTAGAMQLHVIMLW